MLYFRHFSLVILICLMSIGTLFAVPASPRVLNLIQPDGTEIKLRLGGDENCTWHETLDGYIVVKDKADGFWKYTTPKEDQWGFDIIKDAKVGFADPEKLKLKKRDLPDPKFKPKPRFQKMQK